MLATMMWIDDPAIFRAGAKDLLSEAAALSWDEKTEPESEYP